MGLFDFLKGSVQKRIKQLEASLQVRPTPQLFIQLAAAYSKSGDSAKANQILKRGAAMFPQAREIIDLQADAERAERETEKRRLREKIETHPNPILYARLAELYKSEGDIERTIEVARAGINQFPKYGGTYLVLGQVDFERSNFETARQYLEHAVELDKYNYMALRLLAQAYMHLNRPGDAVKRLEDILYFAPGDEAINQLLEEARRMAGGVAAPAPQPSRQQQSSRQQQPARQQQSSRQQQPARQQQPSRSRGAPERRQGDRRQPAGLSEDTLDHGISQLRSVRGVHGALLVDAYGLVVAADLGKIDEGLAGALITNIYRIASQNAPYMGVGDFEEGLIEGETGNIHLLIIEDMILAVFADSSLRLGLLEKKIREFAQSVIEVQ